MSEPLNVALVNKVMDKVNILINLVFIAAAIRLLVFVASTLWTIL